MLKKDRLERLEWVCSYLQAPGWLFNELSEPEYKFKFKVRVPVKGELRTFDVIRVQYCNPNTTGARPFKGGTRYHPGVTEELMEGLSFDMTKKCAIANLPFGGAKGGSPINVKEFSKPELRFFTETWTEEMIKMRIIGPDIDVPGPDVGTNPETMFWMYTKIGNMNRGMPISNVAASVTGKPIEYDGCPGREDATSQGGLIVLQEFLKLSHNLNGTINSKPRVIIQGFGNVGLNLARLIATPQFKLIAISDVQGAIYSPDGLDFNKINQWYRESGSFMNFPGAKHLSNSEMLLLDCDILIPGAIEDQIHENNAEDIKAKMVLELANEAITIPGYKILKARNIPAIPGIVANTGGVVASYIEWSHNRGTRPHMVDLARILGEVENELHNIMKDLINRTYEKSLESGLTMDEAADVLAIETLRDQLKIKHGY